MDVIAWLARVGLTALLLVPLAVCPLPADAADAAKKVLEGMEATKPAWLPSLDQCPADLMPARETKSGFYQGRCESALQQCLNDCGAGKGGDCYASALVLQKVKADSPIPGALFLRACALGVTSGCTNRAASMDSGPGIPCAVRTFAAACDRDDPWACTMIGMHLARGIGIDKDHERARQALSKSCRHGEADEACRAAKALLTEIPD
jgi:hypothetical protein